VPTSHLDCLRGLGGAETLKLGRMARVPELGEHLVPRQLLQRLWGAVA
jgi:hypothetical protein